MEFFYFFVYYFVYSLKIGFILIDIEIYIIVLVYRDDDGCFKINFVG